MTDGSLPPAGWYDDGVTSGVLRWFDGSAWTEHTAPVPTTAPAAQPPLAGAPAHQPASPAAVSAHQPTSPAAAHRPSDPALTAAHRPGEPTRTPVHRPTADRPARASTTAWSPDPAPTGARPAAPGATGSGATGPSGGGFRTAVPARLGESLNLADRITESPEYQRNRLDEALRVRRTAGWMFGAALVVLVVGAAVGHAMGGPDNVWYLTAVLGVVLVARALRDYRRALFRGAPALRTAGWVLTAAGLVAVLVLFLSVPVVTYLTIRDEVDKVVEQTTP